MHNISVPPSNKRQRVASVGTPIAVPSNQASNSLDKDAIILDLLRRHDELEAEFRSTIARYDQRIEQLTFEMERMQTSLEIIREAQPFNTTDGVTMDNEENRKTLSVSIYYLLKKKQKQVLMSII